MRITTWAEYGVICALHLAKRADDGPVTGRDVASREQLPADYVEQILLRLRRAGIVSSTRGAKGGYCLARDAAKITLREIIAAAELQTFDVRCDSHPLHLDRCRDAHECTLRPVWMMLQQRINEALDGVRLGDLLESESQVRQRVGLPVLTA